MSAAVLIAPALATIISRTWVLGLPAVVDAPVPPAVAVLDESPPPAPGEVGPLKVLAESPEKVAADDFVTAPITVDAVTSDVAYGACVVGVKLPGGGGVKLAGAGGKVALGSKVHPFPVGGQAKGVVAGLYAFALVPTGEAFNH